MSYESSIIELNPVLYCPIFVLDSNGPVDIINKTQSLINGSFSVEKSDLFPIRSIVLSAGAFIDVETANVQDFFELPISYSFWFNKENQPGPVFSIGDEFEGFAVSVNENGNLVIFYDGENSETLINSVQDKYHLITVSIDGFLNGEDEEGGLDPTVTVYFDGEPVYETGEFSFPADYDIFFNSFYGEPGESETKISQYFIIPEAINDQEALALYELGVFGRERFLFESSTDIPYLDQNQIALQTSWQAYGIVTGKQ